MGGLLEARGKMLGIFTLHGVPEWNAERELCATTRGGSAIRSKITRGKMLDEHFEKSAQSYKKQFLASCLYLNH